MPIIVYNMSDYIVREHYLDKLRGLRNAPAIKVITGMRRCGKSTLMLMFRDELISSGVSPDDIFYMNFGDVLDDYITDFKGLVDLVKEKFTPSKGKYIMLDEVQLVDGWERDVGTFFDRGADVYITAPNLDMLSSELSTLLSGRYVSIEVLPLSFTEFMRFRETYGQRTTVDEMFSEYMRWGGLPATVLMSGSRRDLVSLLISGIYDTVFMKDVIERNNLRNPAVVGNLSRFLMKNIGDRTSVRNASGYLVSKGIKASSETVDSYILALEKAGLFHRAKRKDSRTKEYLRTSDKFYVNDLGMRNVSLGYDEKDLDGILENLVYMELLFRYGNAYVMNVDDKQIDLVSNDPNENPIYFQVSMNITDRTTLKREMAPLIALKDNYPKYIITLDRYPSDDIDGIRIVNIVDFLSHKDMQRP